MKKIVLAFLSVVLMTGGAFAQDRPKSVTKAKINAAEPQKSNAAPSSDATAPAARTKKDGSLDMRYKSNKEAKKPEVAPSGPMKKDGTPDMRHKANKAAATGK